MRCYHRTNRADDILENGFRDGKGTYMTSMMLEGVFLSDRPLDENEGAHGLVVLKLEIPESVLVPYELVEEDKPYREFCIPAETVNQHGPPTIHEADFQGRSREFLLRMADRHKAAGRVSRAKELREIQVPFLEHHGLLEEE